MPSDYLSRHPGRIHDEAKETMATIETELFVNAVVNANLPIALTMEEIETETQNDPEMQDLLAAIRRKRPDDAIQPHLSQYRAVFHELSGHGNIVVRGHKIVVPRKLREKAVRLAHEAHQGIVKSKTYLRSRMWFPKMDAMLSEVVETCHPCQIVTDIRQRAAENGADSGGTLVAVESRLLWAGE